MLDIYLVTDYSTQHKVRALSLTTKYFCQVHTIHNYILYMVHCIMYIVPRVQCTLYNIQILR